MVLRHLVRVVVVTIVMVLGVVLSVNLASAHEHRKVGNYELTVGFLEEPAIVDEPNGLDLRVVKLTEDSQHESHASDEGQGHDHDGMPVTGLENTLQAEVRFAGQVRKLELRPRYGEPGAYRADFLPTAPGSYEFHIFGTIEGTPIDEWFRSGPETFSEVYPLDTVSFPVAVTDKATLEARLREVDQNVTRAQGIAYVALGGAVVALVAVVAVALATRRPRAVTASQS